MVRTVVVLVVVGRGRREFASRFAEHAPAPSLPRQPSCLAPGATNSGIHGLRAQCLYALGKDEEALQAAEVACQEQPKNGQLHFLRGCLLHAQGSWPTLFASVTSAHTCVHTPTSFTS